MITRKTIELYMVYHSATRLILRDKAGWSSLANTDSVFVYKAHGGKPSLCTCRGTVGNTHSYGHSSVA